MSAEHPDEGTIHAWLDGALGDAESARLSAHVAGCAQCAAAVAEARGLIAGASRVVRALDVSAPGAAPDMTTAWGATTAATRAAKVPAWRRFRVTPARAAIAAALLVVAGLTITRDWDASEGTLQPGASLTDTSASVASNRATVAERPRDALLDSATARHVREALPPRVLERAPGPQVASAPDVPPAPTAVDAAAPLRVAEGRVASKAMRDTAPVPAEHAMVASAAAPPPTARAAMAAAPAAAELGALANRTSRRSKPMAEAAQADRATASVARSEPMAGRCFRIESDKPGARWGSTPLPLDVVLQGADSAEAGPVRLIGANASANDATRWSRLGADSVRIDLRHLGYRGEMRIATTGEQGGGTMQSSPASLQLGEVVVTGAEDRAPKVKARAAPTAAVTRVVVRPIECR